MIPASQQRVFTESIQYLQEHQSQRAQELTELEVKVFDGWDLLQPLIIHIFLDAKSPHASKDLKKDFMLASEFITAARLVFTSIGSPAIPDWAYYHGRFLYLELFKAYDKLCDGVIAVSKQKTHHTNGKIPIEAVLSIKKDARVSGTLIQSQTKELKQQMEKNGTSVIMGLLKIRDIGDAIEDLLGAETVRSYTKKFLESVLESLDGILKVKL